MGYFIDPTLSIPGLGQPPGQPQPPAAPGQMTDAEFLAQQLMDPAEFQRRFGGNPDSTALEKEAVARQMALAQQLQTGPLTGGEGPGATGASGALGGLRHSLQGIRGVMLQNDALGRESALKGQTKNDEYGKTRLKLAMEAMDQQRKAAGEKGKATKDLGDRTDALRREFMGNQVVKDTQQLGVAHRKVLSSYDLSQTNGQGAGDMGLVYGIMKLLDPNSSVREGEVAMANQVGGTASQFLNLYNQMVNGGKLSPGARKQILDLANRQFGSQLEQYKPIAEQYKGLASRFGAAPDDVVIDFGFKAPAKSGAAAAQEKSARQEKVINGKRYFQLTNGNWAVEE